MTRTTYPGAAGFKGDANGPGAEAAARISAQLGRRQREVLEGLGDREETAEQIGERIGRHWYVVRPRLSELKALGLVVETGARGRSAFGGQCTVYRQTTAEERSLFNARKAAAAEHGEGSNNG